MPNRGIRVVVQKVVVRLATQRIVDVLWLESRGKLVRGFVVAGGAARFAIHQAIGANAHIDHRLAQAAILLALAASFGLLALCAATLRRTGSSAHGMNVPRECEHLKRDDSNRESGEWPVFSDQCAVIRTLDGGRAFANDMSP